MLKNAKDACATEALEIATYTALERLARSVGDDETATLAALILADERKMLERILREIPKLAEAVVSAKGEGQARYDVSTTGAGEAVREVGIGDPESGSPGERRHPADRASGPQGPRRRAGRGSGQGSARQ